MENDDREMTRDTGLNGAPIRQEEGGRQPAINLPAFVVISIGLLVAIHAGLEYLASDSQRILAIWYFSFIPARYGELAAQFPMPLAAYWTPLTYSFLHGGWIHLWMNVLWMVVFAAPLARRLGTWRTLAIAVASSLGGAGLHFIFHAGEMTPVVGASAVVSGYMAAAARFAFRRTHPGHGGSALNVHGPALSLAQSFANRRFLTFFGIWMVINLVFGISGAGFGAETSSIAWLAHIGGFMAGLLAFSAVDRTQRNH